MNIHRVILLSSALSIAPLACGLSTSEAPRVRTVASPSASFARYRTFAIGLTEMRTAGYEISPRSLEVQRRLRPLVLAAFEGRGYLASEDAAQADLIVRYASDARIAEALGPEQRPESARVVTEGAIFIDVFERSTGIELWQGSVMADVSPEHIDDALLARGVEELVSRFPTRG
jgi:hypothetical protein